MRQIRRRDHDAYPSDVLERISVLLSGFRTSSTQEQTVERAMNLLLELVPADAALLLGYPAEKSQAVILHAHGAWSSLAGDSVQWEKIRVDADPQKRGEDAPIGKLLEQNGKSPLHLWNVALRSRDRILGSLWIGRASGESQAFSKEELRTAEMIADIAAGGLLHFGLNERVERQRTRLQSMRSVERAITSSLDLNVTLSVFLDQAVGLLRADAAAVLLIDPKSRDLTVSAARGFRRDSRPASRVRADHNLAARAALERKIVSVAGSKPGDPALADQPLMLEEEFLSYHAAPLIAHGQVKGVLEVFRRTTAEQDTDFSDLLDSLALQGAIAIDTAESFQIYQRTHSELSLACDLTIEGWSRAVDLRAREPEGHGLRVSEWTIRTAEKLRYPAQQMLALRRGALLHDIGKLGIPDSILWKPDALTEEEWQLMRQHPKFAEQLLTPIDFLRPAMDIPKFHHEWWDGGGYPYGLSGTDIPLAARIFSVVDVWDSLQTHRPFRGPWNPSDAVRHLEQSSGKQFDPDAVGAFLEVLRGS
jgi:HD-GYP domain-containing protein (c-di-GMP phosphodiesterase class II)